MHIKLYIAKKTLRQNGDESLIDEANGSLKKKASDHGDDTCIDNMHETSTREESMEFHPECFVQLRKLSYHELKPLVDVLVNASVLSRTEDTKFTKGIIRMVGEAGCNMPIAEALNTVRGHTRWGELTAIHEKFMRAILSYVDADLAERKVNGMTDHLCKRALEFVTPRDTRTYIELVLNGFEDSRPAQLLLNRSKTLLQREIRRATLDPKIESLSIGEETAELVENDWYIVGRQANEDQTSRSEGVFQYRHTIEDMNSSKHLFINRAGGVKTYDAGSFEFRKLIPIAESMIRAQKAFMTIEVDHIKKFSYEALMEFEDLRGDLRKLQIISQMQCLALGEARINRLVEMRDSSSTQVNYSDLKAGNNYFVEESPYKYELL